MDPCDFQQVVGENWSHASSLPAALGMFQNVLLDWNEIAFENIFTRKKRIHRCLDGVQRSLAFSPTSGSLKLETKLKNELMLFYNTKRLFECISLQLIGFACVI